MGCPARKVIKKGAGAALLKDPKKIGEICKKVKKITSIPFTVKIRLGFAEENVFEILKVLENEGKYGSKARWEYAKRIKERTGLKIRSIGKIKYSRWNNDWQGGNK